MNRYEVQWIPQDLTEAAARNVNREETHRYVEADCFEIEGGVLLFYVSRPCDPPELPIAVATNGEWHRRELVASFADGSWDCVREVSVE